MAATAAVDKCFTTLASVIGLDIAELWTEDNDGFVLKQIYINREALKAYDNDITDRHTGAYDNLTSRNLCKRALSSKHGFFWLSRKDKTIHPVVPFQTAISFHLQRDNINNVFVVCYALGYVKYAQSKLNFFCWLSNAACVAAFSSSLHHKNGSEDDDYLPDNGDNSPTPLVKSALAPSTDELEASTDSLSEVEKSMFLIEKSLHVTELEVSTDSLSEVEKSLHMTGGRSESSFEAFKSDQNLLSAKFVPLPLLSPRAKRNTDFNFDHGGNGGKLAVPLPIDSSESSLIDGGESVFQLSAVTDSAEESVLADDSIPSMYSRVTTPVDRSSPSSDVNLGAESITETNSFQQENECHPPTSGVKRYTSARVLTQRPSITGSDGKNMNFDSYHFSIDNLPTMRIIDFNVSLDEISGMAFLTEGSNSHIFKATWKNQSVIVKMLQAKKVHDPMARKEFEVEKEILSKINHPHIIEILGAGMVPRPFIILERLTDISQLLDLDPSRKPSLFRRQAVTYSELLEMARGLTDALNYLHSELHPDAMIIHRDLKPDNLGLSEKGMIKLYDFGLIRCVKKKSVETEVYEMTGHTGSIRYMAPEVVLNMPYSEKADVYSFAILIWTIARNKVPFRDLDRAAHKSRVALNNVRPKLQKGWPEDFSKILEACWSPDMKDRPTFKEVTSRLQNMIRSDNSSKKFSMNAPSKLSMLNKSRAVRTTEEVITWS
mmetsp:Transcript_30049/g.28719  ORF Transcript_30049/g.28719 Transcript_30049/m.28719 type:complete len:718 (+) Transcript_30049:221-2374(+)